jgi:broad specificity phosphatase PhoE
MIEVLQAILTAASNGYSELLLVAHGSTMRALSMENLVLCNRRSIPFTCIS